MTELKTREVIIAGFASKLEEVFKQSIEDYRFKYNEYAESLMRKDLLGDDVLMCPDFVIDWNEQSNKLLYFLAKWGALHWTDEKTEKLKQNPKYGLRD